MRVCGACHNSGYVCENHLDRPWDCGCFRECRCSAPKLCPQCGRLAETRIETGVNWWEPRRGYESTAVYLARVLAELGADHLADKARLCHFDDYFCPDSIDDGANIHRLVSEVDEWARSVSRDQRGRAQVVVAAAKRGEFDGTREESERWAASADGQAVFRDLIEDR